MSKYSAKVIGERLRQVRESQGLSVAEAARVLKVRRQTLYNYENGKWLPKMGVLITAARVWDASFEISGCKVVPEGAKVRPPKLEATQLELFKKPHLYKRATVRIRRRNHDLVITAVLPARVRV